jgi:membrane protease YdiL (CAAX protease family)
MRIKPTALIGVLIWLVYGAVVVLIQLASGIPYTEFGDSTTNMLKTTIPSLAAGAVVIVVAALWLGWFRAAMRDENRTKAGWALVAPIIYVIIVIATFAATDWGNVTTGFLLVALALGVLVGFAEEFLCRGLLLVGLRGSVHEVAVWALTCVLFGIMHGLNVFLGAPAGETIVQIVLAMVQGSAFYILRRHFGTLVLAMVLHGLWDMAIFVQASSGAPASLVSSLVWVAAPFAIVGGFVVARRTQRGPLESYARGADAVPAAA